MQKTMLVGILVLLGAGNATASEDKEGLEVSILLGIVNPITKIEGTGDKIGSAGLAVGARLLTPLRTGLHVGVEIQSLNSGETTSTQILANGNATSKFNSLVFLGELRASMGQGKNRPFVLGGLGIHSTAYKLDVAPAAGFVWADTGTQETRSAIDSRKVGIAATIQAGVDFLPSDRLKLGIVGSWYYFGKTTYDSTASARQLFPGFVGLSGAISSIAFLGNVSYMF